MYRKVSESELMEAIISSRSRAEVLKKIGLVPRGGNYATINNLIKKYNIDTSHMTGQGWNKGMKQEGVSKRAIPMAEVLIKDSTFTSSDHLRKRLLKVGIKEHRCDKCLRQTWNDIPIALELHHVNGDRLDHRIENIVLLCPNCHAQTDTYCGKNISSKGKTTISNISKKQVNKIPVEKLCKHCGKTFASGYTFCSKECAANSAKRFNVSKEELKRLIWELPTSKIAEQLGVSDNAIGNRCKTYGIEKPPRGYWRKVECGKI